MQHGEKYREPKRPYVNTALDNGLQVLRNNLQEKVKDLGQAAAHDCKYDEILKAAQQLHTAIVSNLK